jgi:hypothetical protein
VIYQPLFEQFDWLECCNHGRNNYTLFGRFLRDIEDLWALCRILNEARVLYSPEVFKIDYHIQAEIFANANAHWWQKIVLGPL